MHAPHLDTLLQQRDVRLEGAQLRLERGEAALGLVDPGLVVLVLVPAALRHNFRWKGNEFSKCLIFYGVDFASYSSRRKDKVLVYIETPLCTFIIGSDVLKNILLRCRW